ncbi:MAG: hypothetical protein ACE14L_00775 [Terriglobales bacterium]
MQDDLTAFINAPVEYFRPQPDYDYSRPPHTGILNYEAWKWPISPESVCRCFREYLATLDLPRLPQLSTDPQPATLQRAAAGRLQ